MYVSQKVRPTSPGISRRTVAMALAGQSIGKSLGPRTDRWVVYYSNKGPVEAFRNYSCLIFDSRYHPPLEPLTKSKKKLIGYLSLGEAAADYTYFEELKQQGLLLRPSATWQGNQYIDIRDERWLRRVIDELVPSVLRQGFHGLFLDTLDSPLYLEQLEPVRYQGMTDAAVAMIKAIRRRFSKATVVLNRAYGLLDSIGSEIDVVVGESVYSTFNFATKTYELVAADAYRRQVELLKAAKRRARLQIYTLDYWDPSDSAGIAHIYEVERANGFVPYVASIDLTSIVTER
jgi:uncharacterized protein (TIGR01370 family)